MEVINSENQNENGVFVEFHKNPSLNNDDMKKTSLTGILRLILIKYISSFIDDLNQINSKEIKEIVSVLKKWVKLKENPENEIKSNLTDNSGKNILTYSNYITSIVTDKIIDDLLNLVSSSDKYEIFKFWSLLSKYEEINNLFEIEISKAIENSYFEYSLINLSIYEQEKRQEFLEKMKFCPNLVKKYLFHGTQIDPITKILTKGFIYPRKPFFGVGIYFSDLLDYIALFCGFKDYYSRRSNFGRVPSVDQIFSCISAEVYYNDNKKKEINYFSLYCEQMDHFPTYEEIKKNYPDKMVQKDGVNYAIVDPIQGRVRNKDDIINDIKSGKFLENEYVITELYQILPLYGLTFKRDEYLIIWRDPHFTGANKYFEYLEGKKSSIYKYSKMNAYFVSSIEKALEIIKRKKFNKIIIISNIGLDLSGKRFVEIARHILGFNIVVLFFSRNKNHLSWLQNFPNALFANNSEFLEEYILNYSEKGLLNLINKVEKYYKIKLIFYTDFFKFENFVKDTNYDNLFYNKPSPYFKKVIIKNDVNRSILYMDDNMKPGFKSDINLNISSYYWYITIKDKEITLYSNGCYLSVNIELKKITGEKYMKVFKYEKINENEYLIYYNDKNNVLTINNNNAIIDKERTNKSYQIFKLIEDIGLN